MWSGDGLRGWIWGRRDEMVEDVIRSRARAEIIMKYAFQHFRCGGLEIVRRVISLSLIKMALKFPSKKNGSEVWTETKSTMMTENLLEPHYSVNLEWRWSLKEKFDEVLQKSKAENSAQKKQKFKNQKLGDVIVCVDASDKFSKEINMKNCTKLGAFNSLGGEEKQREVKHWVE